MSEMQQEHEHANLEGAAHTVNCDEPQSQPGGHKGRRFWSRFGAWNGPTSVLEIGDGTL
jgi:hypothetical protein